MVDFLFEHTGIKLYILLMHQTSRSNYNDWKYDILIL